MTARHELSVAQVRALFDDALLESGGVRALARRAGLSPTYISRVKTGREPIAGRLLEHLGVGVITIYYRRRA